MATTPQSTKPVNAATDVARLGLVRPPFVYFISLRNGGADPAGRALAICSSNARCAARSGTRSVSYSTLVAKLSATRSTETSASARASSSFCFRNKPSRPS
jgi:hypothetical protein